VLAAPHTGGKTATRNISSKALNIHVFFPDGAENPARRLIENGPCGVKKNGEKPKATIS
jgi:hypothetical protein